MKPEPTRMPVRSGGQTFYVGATQALILADLSTAQIRPVPVVAMRDRLAQHGISRRAAYGSLSTLRANGMVETINVCVFRDQLPGAPITMSGLALTALGRNIARNLPGRGAK